MVNKILILMLIFLSFGNITFAETLETKVSLEYNLNSKDLSIVKKLENRIENIVKKNKKIKLDLIISLLNKKVNKIKNIRFKFILKETVKNLNNKLNKVTILEGWNIFDIDKYLSDKKLIKKGEYISYVENKEKIKALSKFFTFIDNQSTLEGYLYPDTYEINSKNFKINEFVIKQLEAFEIKVYNKLFKGKYSNDIIESVMNLSSIVEKEEKNSLEKPVVAGILKKRVKEYWNIGADITVCYSYRLTGEECKLVVSKYINIKSEYNTRTIIGLPPTPIGNPSYDTVNSTLKHKTTDYYYYLHNTDTGKIYYAKTNLEHSENKRLYLK